MAATKEHGANADQSSEYYLPGMAQLSDGPGIVERFVTNLFRRRGTYRMVVRRDGR